MTKLLILWSVHFSELRAKKVLKFFGYQNEVLPGKFNQRKEARSRHRVQRSERCLTPLWLWCIVNTTTCSAALLNWDVLWRNQTESAMSMGPRFRWKKTSYFMWWFLCSGSFVGHIAFTVCIWTLIYMPIFGYILWILISHFMLWLVSGCYDEKTYKQFPILFWKPEGPLRLLTALNRTTLSGYLKWSRHRNAGPLDTGNKMQEY